MSSPRGKIRSSPSFRLSTMAKAISMWRSRARPLYVILLTASAVTLGYVAITMPWNRRSPPPWLERPSPRPRNVSGIDLDDLHESLLEWKLYGVELMPYDKVHRIIQGDNSESAYYHSSSVLLETVSKNFQEHLHDGTPLSCHTGQDGLISVKYERFLRTLVNYTSFHKKSRESNARTLVWQGRGGLVDMLKGITYTLLLAIFSHRRLVLNWGGLGHTFLTPNLIDWNDAGAMHGPVPKMKGTFVLSDWGRTIKSQGQDIKFTFETIVGKTEAVVLSTNLKPRSLRSGVKTAHQKWIQSGLRQAGLDSLSPDDLDNVVGIVFRYLFQTKPELLEEVTHARNVLGLDGRPYTAVHIRTGFAGSSHSLEAGKHPKLVKNESVWEAMLKCGLSTADTLLGNNSLLFLATDSTLVKHLAVSKYGARFRTLDNRLIHVGQSKQVSSLNEKEGILVGLVEFLLLAEAYSHVRGFSGYSWAAGLLCSLPGERVIDGLKCVPESQVKRYGCSGGPYCVPYID